VNIRRMIAMATGALLAAGLLGAIEVQAPSAEAATASDFNPGNIISDALFFDGAAMSAAEVQSFLNARVPSCRSGYTCLKDYRQNTPNRAAESGRCSAYSGAANESAATIIYRVGVACGVSQKAMLVLLEKEQSLVSDTWPASSQYRSATGYGCPDTAACDSTYYGFFNQVYMAALQFKRYAANPTGWNHIAGRVNSIRFHPNAACGSSSVFIQNQATAGLYNYTPYQPNAAALANLYGSGDGCSAYGNRNFWRIFTDWFGSTTAGSSLIRTAANATVYVTSGSYKYPVPSLAILNALFPLGNVAFVSQSQLDRYQTRHPIGRVIRSGNGTIYFFDAGIKLPFSSCDQVVDYGGSCGPDGYVQLTDAQIAAFANGPAMRSVLGTNDGARYYVNDGTKREILDNQSQAEAGIPAGYNVLTEGAVSALSFATPVVRESAFSRQRGASSYFFLTGGGKHPVDAAAVGSAGLPSRAAGSLRAESLGMLPSRTPSFTGIVRAPGSSVSSVLVGDGRYEWAAGSLGAGVGFTAVSQAFLDSYPLKGSITAGATIKTASSATVYMVMADKILPIGSWEALIALSAGKTPTITTVPDSLVAALPKGPVALTTGTLVRTSTDATVYLVNGVTNKIALSSFVFTSEAGITKFTFTTQARMDAYPRAEGLLGFGLACGDVRYVSAAGSVHRVDPTIAALYPFSYMPLDSFTCALLTKGRDANAFIRVPNGTVYHLVDGTKRPITSMARLTELNKGAGWLDVVPQFAALIPTGPNA
jgi:hypothetical protein